MSEYSIRGDNELGTSQCCAYREQLQWYTRAGQFFFLGRASRVDRGNIGEHFLLYNMGL